MTTATIALPNVKAFTERRDADTLNIMIKWGYDSPVYLGTMRKTLTGLWYAESVSTNHRFFARTKWEAILEMCRLEGSHHYSPAAFCFGGHVLRVEP